MPAGRLGLPLLGACGFGSLARLPFLAVALPSSWGAPAPLPSATVTVEATELPHSPCLGTMADRSECSWLGTDSDKAMWLAQLVTWVSHEG